MPSSLTLRQHDLLATWLPGANTLRDHSWGLVGTTVLELQHDGERYIVKAGDDRDHHIAREIHAHRHWLTPWTSRRRAPHLVHADEEAKLLVTRFLPGSLVQGRDDEHDPDTYRQAGTLLAQLHAQTAVADDEFEARQNARSLQWLAGPHRITRDTVTRLRDEVQSWLTPPVTLVPTHGDWQPRNWLVHDGVISVIDFGRADLRPALTDFTRLATQQFRTGPTLRTGPTSTIGPTVHTGAAMETGAALEAAFLDGYGPDPREPDAWRRQRFREAIGTAAWAHQVGDETFERQGHRMIADALTDQP